jgi:hypothetical protein
MNKNVKNGLMVGGGVLLVYWIWKSMQVAPTTTASTSIATPVTPVNPPAQAQVGQVGSNFSGTMESNVVGNRVW